MAPHLDPLPADEYPADEWRLVEHGIHDRLSGRMETLFALSNGYLGIRGTYDEMTPVAEPGTFLNGYYESWPIVYPESAYGFATSGQTIVNVPDATSLRIMMNGEELGRPDESTRTLDMRSGILERRAQWRTSRGAITLRSERLVSLSHRNVAAVRWTITTDMAVTIDAHTGISPQQPSAEADADHSDPRRAREFTKDILGAEYARATERRMVLTYRTAGSGLPMACGAELAVAGPEATISAGADDGSANATVTADLDEATSLTVTKLLAYHTAGAGSATELAAEIDAELDAAAELGFEGLATAQRAELDRAWEITDIRVGADAATQQAVRWNLFQLIQATHCVKRSGVGAKGQTSLGYDGHYFWDMDMFLMPFITHTRPDLARELLLFRWDTLGQARRRAHEMSQTGALYPWRTINGEEASAFFPAGTAQYHINAAVAYAIKRLAEVAPEDDFLLDHGAEIVLETARLWHDLGFFDDTGAFHLHGVTGPDEYTALVNDNTYTNLMAQMHLDFAADLTDWLAEHHPARSLELIDRLRLTADEIDGWRRAARNMTVLYDDDLGIHAQDAMFLDLEVWDFDGTPDDEYPLLLHHHPLVLYRRQVLKQSDVVLAMVLRGDLFDAEQKARNFAYYEPLTTDDSSLSTPIQAIVAAEVGAAGVAARCFEQAIFADLADVYGNASDGVHLASCGASWMTLVMGFGGMRDYGGNLSFHPQLPAGWTSLEFRLGVRNSVIDVAITADEASFTLHSGDAIDLTIGAVIYRLDAGTPVRVASGSR